MMNCLRCFLFLLLLMRVSGQDAPALQRGDYAAFAAEADVLSPTDTVLRRAVEGEVVQIRMIKDEWASVGSGVANLEGGKVKLQELRPATEEEYNQWVAAAGARASAQEEEQRLAAMPLSHEPPPEVEAKLEAAEAVHPKGAPVANGVSVAKSFPTPVVGWFHPGRETVVRSVAVIPDGSVVFCGAVRFPVSIAGARGWGGSELPVPDPAEDVAYAFLARMAPDLKSVADFVVFRRDEIGDLDRIQVAASGAIWIAAKKVGEALGGNDAPKSADCLLQFSADFKSVVRPMALTGRVQDFALVDADHPVVLGGGGKRSGGNYVSRFFGTGRYERKWPEAPDGPARRITLDFSSPSLADGPFALWSKKSETLPDFPTPIGAWGTAANAGQPVQWTNVKSGQNPIRGANLKAEAMVVDNEGCVVVAGTIPFTMGFPDFDPFLMRFSPEGKLLWTNCFLTGLLSEPDQKTQALAIDPSNGDIIVCYWQHGNNRETLLLDPDGWLNKFTGTNGNIKITWIGRVDAKSGRLKNSTYIYAQMPDQKNPRWPDLNSAGVESLAVDAEGRIYVCGGTTISFPTTSNAFLPHVSEYGGHPMFAVLKPDLSAPVYSTYLSAGKGGADHVVIVPGGALMFGKHETEGVALPVTGGGGMPFLSATPPEGQKTGVFVSFLPVPSEEASWSFGN